MNIPLSIWLSNLQFLLAALSFFAFFSAAALYLDSWIAVRRASLLLIRSVGFGLLALWAAFQGVSVAPDGSAVALQESLLTLALAIIALSFFAERLPGRPLEARVEDAVAPTEPPRVSAQTQQKNTRQVFAFLATPLLASARFVSPLLGLAIAGRLWYQATARLERGRKVLAWAMFFLAVSWLVTALRSFPSVRGGGLSVLAEPFGAFWVVARVAEMLGIVLLLRWTWGFLRFRLFPQLYLTVVGAMLSASVVAAIVLIVILVQRTQAQTLRALETNAHVFVFTLEELQSQITLVASALGNRSALVEAVAANDVGQIVTTLGNPVEEFRVGAVTVLNAGGEVVRSVGSELKEGESVSADPVAIRAFQGEGVSSPMLYEGPELSTVTVRAGAPLIKDGAVVGGILVDFPVDSVFLDRVKRLTGLEVVLHGRSRQAATTLRDASGRPRLGLVGEAVLLTEAVLNEGKTFLGSSLVGSEPFLVAGLPLLDVDNERIAALVVGLPEATFLRSIEASVRAALLSSLALMGISLVPLYGMARVITRYQRS